MKFTIITLLFFITSSCVGMEKDVFYFSSIGARAIGLGGAFTSREGEPSCAFWNPAGLAKIKEMIFYTDVSSTFGYFSYGPYYSKENYSIEHSSFGGAFFSVPFENFVLTVSQYSPYEVNSKDGETSWRGNIFRDEAFGRILRTSISISSGIEKISAGVNFNYNKINFRGEDFLYDKSNFIEKMDWRKVDFNGKGSNIDIGILLKPESGEEGGIFGVMLSLGTWVRGNGERKSYFYFVNRDTLKEDTLYSQNFTDFVDLPWLLKFGLNIYKKNFSLSGELAFSSGERKPIVYPPDRWFGTWYYLPREFKIPYARVGAELLLPRNFSLRLGGYGFSEEDPTIFTIGTGFKIKKFTFDFSVENSMVERGNEGIKRFVLGASYGFGKKIKL